MKELTHFSLFTGIGGIDLAAEWAGFKTAGQCEWADYPTKVLEKHWPNVPRWRDIRSVTRESIEERGIQTVDLITGGFPCQPFSVAGKQKGKEDNRYLWPEMLRVIRELKPTWVIGENVPGILSIAADEVCQDLEREGYEVGIFDYEAAAVGAKHRRERIFFVGHAKHNGLATFEKLRGNEKTSYDWRQEEPKTFGESEGTGGSSDECGICGSKFGSEQCACGEMGRRANQEIKYIMADTDSERCEQGTNISGEKCKGIRGCVATVGGKMVAYTSSERWKEVNNETRNTSKGQTKWESWTADCFNRYIWKFEPNVGRVANGISFRVDRLKCLGNAVVPQQIYPILKAIYDIEMGVS